MTSAANARLARRRSDVPPAPPERLSAHFTLAEFVASQTAARRGLDNRLPLDLVPAAMDTADMLERVREHLGRLLGREVPIRITSGYRSGAVNAAVGGSERSDHLTAQAADITAPSFGDPLAVSRALVGSLTGLRIGQLVLEYPASASGGWVHLSTRLPGKTVDRVITRTAQGYELGLRMS